jgi:hypothetical protein
MANIENIYAGDGVTVLFSFTFPYIDETDVKVSLDGVDTTAYSLANATTVELNSPPNLGVVVRVYRSTAAETARATFYPGSAIKAGDLNDNFEQVLYVAQESVFLVDEAEAAAEAAAAAVDVVHTAADAALAAANEAVITADEALYQADAATLNAAAAVDSAAAAELLAGDALDAAATAEAAATAAVASISAVVSYTPVANVAAIPGSPANNTRIEVADSTGIQSFSPLAGRPVGFTGESGLAVRLVYTTSGATWNWVSYYPSDPESRYISSADTATESLAGIVELATAAETTTGTDNTRAVHPAGLKVELDKKAPLASPTLTGTPAAPTASPGTNTTQIATTEFVSTAVANVPTSSETVSGLVELATAAETTTGTSTTLAVHPAGLKVELDKKAPSTSPTLTGTPTAPTASVGTNTTQIATTAFVNAEIANDVPSASETVAGRVELATAAETTTGTDNTRAVHPAGLKVELDKKANLASPALTGTPTAPTAANGTNTTQIATTAFVLANAGSGFTQSSNSGSHGTTGNVVTVSAGAKQIDIYYVSSSATSSVNLRLGTGGALVSSAVYAYTYSKIKSSSSPAASLTHDGAQSLIALGGESTTLEISLHLFNDSGTHWTVTGTARNSNGVTAANVFVASILGDADIGGELDRVAIGTFNSNFVTSTMYVLYA